MENFWVLINTIINRESLEKDLQIIQMEKGIQG